MINDIKLKFINMIRIKFSSETYTLLCAGFIIQEYICLTSFRMIMKSRKAQKQ